MSLDILHKSFPAIKMDQDSIRVVQDDIVVESPLQIKINGKPFTITMRTPGSDHQLVRGLLYTEGIYRNEKPLDIRILEKSEEGIVISLNVWIDRKDIGANYFQTRSMLSVASCGICGKKELSDVFLKTDKIKPSKRLNVDLIPAMFELMKNAQSNFQKTGGSHAAATFNSKGELLDIHEDIGRHNAVDKVIGAIIDNNRLKEALCLLVSGRISFEIVSKCYQARIPYLAAVSSPSSLSIESAKAMGICLMAFCRGNTVNSYSCNENLVYQEVELINY